MTKGSFKGKTFLISGASRGIGLAFALKFAKLGANIAIAAKTTQPHPKVNFFIIISNSFIDYSLVTRYYLYCGRRN